MTQAPSAQSDLRLDTSTATPVTARPPLAQASLVLIGGGETHLALLRLLARKPMVDTSVVLLCTASTGLVTPLVPDWMSADVADARCLPDLAALTHASGVRHLSSPCVRFDAGQQTLHLSDGQSLSADVVSLDLPVHGDVELAGRQMPGAAALALFVRPLDVLVNRWPAVRAMAQQRPVHLAVIGEDMLAVEIALAAAAAVKHPHGSRISLVTQGTLPGRALGPRGSDMVMERLREQQVTVLQTRCVGIDDGEIVLANGARLVCDVPVVVPAPCLPAWLAGSGLRHDSELLSVNASGQSLSHTGVFVHGDLCNKAGGSALGTPRHARRVLLNLRAVLGGQAPGPLPQRSRQWVSLGDRQALMSQGEWLLEGRLPWLIWQLTDRA